MENPAVPRDFRSLTDQEVAAFQMELSRHVDPAAVTSIEWIRRAVLSADGQWHLSFRKPTEPNLGLNRDRPWEHPPDRAGLFSRDPNRYAGLKWVAATAPVAEAIALLHSPNSPDAEVRRREELFAEAWRVADEQAAEHAAAVQRDRLIREEYKRRRPERWMALPQLQKALLIAAAGPQPGYAPGGVGTALEYVARLLSLPPDASTLDEHHIPATFERQFA